MTAPANQTAFQRWRNIRAAAALLLAGLAAAGPAAGPPADRSLPAYSPARRLAGHIIAAGNRATDPLMTAWVRGFAAHQPGVAVTLRNETKVSTDAFDAAIAASDIDIIPAARELVPSEVDRLTAKLGGPPLVIAVATGSYATKSATHALAFYVNAANPLTRISLDQIRKIYGPKGEITKWGQLGLRGEWADRPITVFSVPVSDPNGNPLGIINYLRNRLFGGRPGLRRSLYQIDSTGPGLDRHMLTNIVRRVEQDRYAIGFSGFAFATPGVRSLEIAETGEGPWFKGTLEEVRARTYPLTRTIYIAVHHRQGSPLRPELREFLRYVLSREGQSIFAQGVGAYLPLTAAAADAERRKLD